MKKVTANNLLMSCALLLSLFITLIYFVTVILYFSGGKMSPVIWPLTLLATLLTGLGLFKRQGLSISDCMKTTVVFLLVICSSLLLSFFFFDISWDGQWYHQAAIYALTEGWNPVSESVKAFEGNNDLSIVHFPKAMWYYAAATTTTFGNIESGKSIQFIFAFITLIVTYNGFRTFKMSRSTVKISTLLVMLCPIVWSQITTYLVDGLMYQALVIYTICIISWLKTKSKLYLLLSVFAMVWAINLKFTGFFFIGISGILVFIYAIVYYKSTIKPLIIYSVAATVISIALFGFNPYITNIITNEHPLYPIIGTKNHPSVYEQTGKDANEEYETPKNLIGKSSLYNFLYTTYSKPGNPPYHTIDTATLIIPLNFSASDLNAYVYHETRTAGFGPFYGICLILASVIVILLLFRTPKKAILIIMAMGTIFVALVLNKHFWWPRFLPQLWLLPCIPVIAAFMLKSKSIIKKISMLTATLLIINAVIVLVVHLHYETTSSVKLEQQLSEMKLKNTPVNINYGWFKTAIEKRMAHYEISFKPVKGKEIRKMPHDTLVSVAPYYPNAVLFVQE